MLSCCKLPISQLVGLGIGLEFVNPLIFMLSFLSMTGEWHLPGPGIQKAT